jgi:hypothetical protein
VPAINEAMTKAAALPAGPGRNKAWGEIDKMVTEQAPAIPFIWDKVPTVESCAEWSISTPRAGTSTSPP